jgi:ABC-type transport system substrate-binding protein
VLDSWQRDEAVTLKKNPNYWGEPTALDTLVFKVVKEDGARLVEIEAGTADVAVRVPPAEAARLAANPNIEHRDDARPAHHLHLLQRHRGALHRRARAPGRQLRRGRGRHRARPVRQRRAVSDAPFAPPIFGYSAQTPYARDVDRAKELLEEAGIEPGTKVVLYHPTGRYIQDALVADAVRSQLREVGLEVELQTLEWPQYVPTVRKEKPENDVQFAMLGWGTPTMDADYALFALFHSSQHPPGFNGAFYENPEVDALLDEARTNPDQDARQQPMPRPSPSSGRTRPGSSSTAKCRSPRSATTSRASWCIPTSA